MTQLPDTAGLPANITPAQLQAIMSYLAQNQIHIPVSPGGPSPSSGSGVPVVLTGPGVAPHAAMEDTGTGAAIGTPSRLKTPPPILRTSFVFIDLLPSETLLKRRQHTPSNTSYSGKSKVQAEIGSHLRSSDTIFEASPAHARRKEAKGPLPTGFDPALTFEEPMAVDEKPLPGQPSASVSASAPDDQESSDPFEGFPEIVTVPPKPSDTNAAADTSANAESSVAAGANDPADTDMQIDTPSRIRSSRYSSDSSPPPSVKRSPKKKVRVQSPRRSPTRASVSSKKKKSSKKSPTSADEQPSPVPTSSADPGPSEATLVPEDTEVPKVDEDAVRTLESWLEQVKQGRALAEIGITFNNNASSSPVVNEEVSNRHPSLHDEAARPPRSRFIDDEADESGPGQDGADEGEDLDGFIVPDNVVEYDGDAPALPDDDDNDAGEDGDNDGDNDDDDDKPLTLRRLHRRSSVSTQNHDQHNDSDVEIVDKVDKGKGRAVPIPTSFSSKSISPSAAAASLSVGASGSTSRSNGNSTRSSGVTTDNAVGASSAPASSGNVAGSGSQSASKEPAWASLKSVTTLYPGSMAADASAKACPRLQLDGQLFTYASHNYELFQSINFADGVKPVPGGCAFVSDFSPDGYGNPNVDLVAAAETNIHRKNLIFGMLLRRQGCFINDATIDPAEIIAVQVSPAGSTLRYKTVLADTRAPAVSITPGVVRIWSLDTPTNNAHPVRFLAMTPLEALVDRFIGCQCMTFGQRELTVITLNNAIRFATVPAFGRPAHPVGPSSSSLSSSMRRNNAGPSMRRSVNFEPTTNDPIAVLDARRTKLPDDVGLWTTVLPRFEGPLPDNAVAFVAHTTSMWVGTRSTTAPSGMTYNVQHNLVFVVIIGELPAGYV
ncbi:hypothetical protein EV715DRAFT_268201 [Schizophyllum commune]